LLVEKKTELIKLTEKLKLHNPSKPTWIEININNFLYNLSSIKEYLGPFVKLMAIVKADAYGHGAIPIAKIAEKAGIDAFGVATIDEGIELRKAGIISPILVLSCGVFLNQLDEIIEYNLTQNVFSLGMAKALSRKAKACGKKAKVHVKIETGMGRVGIKAEAADKFIESLLNLPGLEVEGIYTHFATADAKDTSYCMWQFQRFTDLLSRLEARGIKFNLKHAANSAAMLNFKNTHLNMVRVGLALYGHYPSQFVKRSVHIKPLMSVKTKIGFLKEVPENTSISYGKSFITKRRSIIATLPIGYADGLSRLLSNQHTVLVKGIHCPIIGNICMDECMIDVTEVPDVSNGNEVVIMGKSGNNEITAEEIAEKIGTINYEILCQFRARAKRIYLGGNNNEM